MEKLNEEVTWPCMASLATQERLEDSSFLRGYMYDVHEDSRAAFASLKGQAFSGKGQCGLDISPAILLCFEGSAAQIF
jgi:hypothetical protein